MDWVGPRKGHGLIFFRLGSGRKNETLRKGWNEGTLERLRARERWLWPERRQGSEGMTGSGRLACF